MSGQLEKLEIEEADLYKKIDLHLADVKCHLAQNKNVSAVRTYQCFFETNDDLQKKQ